MSDTSKATPRPWRKSDRGTKVSGKPVFALLGSKHGDFRDTVIASYLWKESDADLALEAVNSYNPERDQLARELAEAWLSPTTDDHTPEEMDTVARKLLRRL